MNSEILVLIPHYNDLKGLYKSLDSLDESIPIDVLIVDDGSKEKPELVYLKNNYSNLNNIILIALVCNGGIENALNIGLDFVRSKRQYKYIARLDSGDTCYKDRLFIQSSFLNDNPDISLVGAWASCVDLNGVELYQFKHPTNPKDIKNKMYIRNMFVHPAVMFRTEAIEKIGYYPTEFKYAEDYAYFFQFTKHLETANIPLPLIKYEINTGSISIKNRRKQVGSKIKVILKNWDLNIYAIAGLIYNIILYYFPLRLLQKIKKRLYY